MYCRQENCEKNPRSNREEEIQKLQKEFEELVGKCGNLPASAPTKDFGRVDRMIQRMIKNLKGENSGTAYDSLTLVNKLGVELIAARDAAKACVAFMTGSAVTRKRNQQDRWLLNFPIPCAMQLRFLCFVSTLFSAFQPVL